MKLRFYIRAIVFGFALGVGGVFPISISITNAQSLSPEERAKLQTEYDQLQQEIANWQKILDDTKSKKNTLTGDVTILDAQIKKAQKEIQQRGITITRLGSEINKKAAAIDTLEDRLSSGRESLAKLMREKNEVEQQSLAILALSSEDLSGFFGDIQHIDTIDMQLQGLFAELRGIKDQTEKEKEELDAKKNAELDARHEVVTKQNIIKGNQQEKKELLAITKKNEQSYQAVLAERQKRANDLRSALFELRDSDGISFQTALDFALEAQKVTGVRAAFILGILRQESNLGVNVGQCFLVDPATGAGKGKNTGTPIKKVMKPDRDVEPFLDLTSRLLVNPYSQPISCPQSIGYGGAMGPAQFIPSTWKLYEKRLMDSLGVNVANPWNARTAVVAMGMYLEDLKADRGTYSAEREAAARYYAGGNWKKSGLGYAASVLKFADKYQTDIDFLKDN